jgi:uncharacterized protein YdeI (YjbR/CyaY-like superfamily)
VSAPRFFRNAAGARRWFERHHARELELLVGFWKARIGRGASYQEVLDAALCFGWIDGVRKGRDAETWTIRFTPRKPHSIWSAINIRRVELLTAEGRMHQAGLAAFAARDEKRSRVYSYEATKEKPLGARERRALEARAEAWAYFQAQRPSYRKQASYWVMSAKKPETRARRLAGLIDACARGEWLPQYRWGKR